MYKYFKRTFDLIFAIVLSILFLPIFVLLSLLIKLESTGPVFFSQKRSGRNGVLFDIYKFRSMKVGTPNLSTDKLGDPKIYITKVGKILRKSSLDELPQLINIIKGEMSFIGPRPALYNQFELLELRDKDGINELLPGITGFAQVMGRDFISDQQKVIYDKYYLDNFSFKLDLKIIVLTILRIITAENVKG